MRNQSPKLIIDLSRQVILEIAPQEIPLFQATSEAYFKNPKKMLKGDTDKEEMLGFGVGQVATILTPIVLHISMTMVQYVVEISKEPLEEVFHDKIKDEMPGFLGSLTRFLKKLLGLSETLPVVAVTEIPALTQEQLTQVQKLAFEKACQFDLSEDQAALLAESLVGRLAINS